MPAQGDHITLAHLRKVARIGDFHLLHRPALYGRSLLNAAGCRALFIVNGNAHAKRSGHLDKIPLDSRICQNLRDDSLSLCRAKPHAEHLIPQLSERRAHANPSARNALSHLRNQVILPILELGQPNSALHPRAKRHCEYHKPLLFKPQRRFPSRAAAPSLPLFMHRRKRFFPVISIYIWIIDLL